MRLVDDEPDGPPQINITPMIDVIFSILAFFVVSTLFLTRSQGLPVELPQAKTGERSTGQSLVITIRADGSVWLATGPEPGAQPSPRPAAGGAAAGQIAIARLDQLAPAIRDRRANGPTGLVVLNADRSVAHGRVVAVMDALRGLPGLKLAIATEPGP